MTQAAKLAVFAPASWTTATRPASPIQGQVGFNTTLGYLEVYNGSSWGAM
jgi:hypothetical protein